jgi:hypothetical protein
MCFCTHLFFISNFDQFLHILKGVRSVQSSSHLVTAGATPIHLDLHDPSSFQSALSHCDVLVLITPSPLEKVFDATEGLAEAAKRQNR